MEFEGSILPNHPEWGNSNKKIPAYMKIIVLIVLKLGMSLTNSIPKFVASMEVAYIPYRVYSLAVSPLSRRSGYNSDANSRSLTGDISSLFW